MRYLYLLLIPFLLISCERDVEGLSDPEPDTPNSFSLDTAWTIEGNPGSSFDIHRMIQPISFDGNLTIVSTVYLFDQPNSVSIFDGASGDLIHRNNLLLPNPSSSNEPAMICKAGSVLMASTYRGWNAVDLKNGNLLWSVDNTHHWMHEWELNRATSLEEDFFYFKPLSGVSDEPFAVIGTSARSYSPREIFNSNSVPGLSSVSTWNRGITAVSRPNNQASLVIYGNAAFRDSAFVCFIDIKTGEVQSLEFFDGIFARGKRAIGHNGTLYLPLEREIRAYSLNDFKFKWSRLISRSTQIEFIPVDDRLIIYASGRRTGGYGIWMELNENDGSIERSTSGPENHLALNFYDVVDSKIYYSSDETSWGHWDWATMRLQIFNSETFEFELSKAEQDSIGTIHGGVAYDEVNNTIIVQRRHSFEAIHLPLPFTE